MTRAGVTDNTHDHEKYSNLVCLGSAIYQVSQQVLDRITYELKEGGQLMEPSFILNLFVKDSNFARIRNYHLKSNPFKTFWDTPYLVCMIFLLISIRCADNDFCCDSFSSTDY